MLRHRTLLAFLLWLTTLVGADDGLHKHMLIETNPPGLEIYQLGTDWKFMGRSNNNRVRLFVGNGGEVILRFYWPGGRLRNLLNPLLGPVCPPLQDSYTTQEMEQMRRQGWVLFTRPEGDFLRQEIPVSARDRLLVDYGDWLPLVVPLVGVLWWRRRSHSVVRAESAARPQNLTLVDHHSLPWELPAHSSINQYQVEKRLGEGAFAIVYKVRDSAKAELPLALKILKGPDALGSEATPRFLREMDALRKLRHPHIPFLADTGEYRGVPYLVMEFIDGESLRSQLEKGPLNYVETLNWLAQLASALKFAHQHGIIHRDVKPENVMCRRRGSVCLTDFGLAKEQDCANLTASGSILGTPGYLPPELLRGQPPSALGDQYSFGCMAFEMLTRHMPYQGTNMMEMMMAHLQNPIPDPRTYGSFPQWVVELVQRMMQKEPAMRFPDLSQVERQILLMVKSR